VAERGIVQKILDTATDRGKRILEEARLKRDAAFKQGLSRLSAELDTRGAAARKHEAEAESQELSAFRLFERNVTLKLKRGLLDGIREEAWRKLLEPKTYRRWIEAQMEANCRPGDSLIVSSDQMGLFVNELSELLGTHKVSVSGRKGRFRAGFIIERGTLRLNCTLDEAVKNALRESEVEISRMLFG
jgi:vacuolar-type H+-ATPase subunit E/Vma4